MAKTEKTRRVVQALKETGLSQNEIARRIGVSPSAVNHWFNEARENSNVTDQYIPALARLTQKTETWLLTGFGKEDDYRDESAISIPVLDVRASAGVGIISFEDEQVLKRIDVDKNWLKGQCSYSSPNNLSVITAAGDSMEPTIFHGDFLLVDQGVNFIRSDSIYVAVINDNLYVKRFQLTPRNTLLMLSDNQRYKEFEVDPQRDNVRIIGKVIYHWHGQPR